MESFGPSFIGHSFSINSAALNAELMARMRPGWLVIIVTS